MNITQDINGKTSNNPIPTFTRELTALATTKRWNTEE